MGEKGSGESSSPAASQATGFQSLIRRLANISLWLAIGIGGTIGANLGRELLANNSTRPLVDAAAIKTPSLGALKRYFPDDYNDFVTLIARRSVPVADTTGWTRTFLSSHVEQESAAPDEALAAETSAFAALVSQLQQESLPACAAMARSGASPALHLSEVGQKLADHVTETRIIAAYRGGQTPALRDNPSDTDVEQLRGKMEELHSGSYDRLATVGATASDAEMCSAVVALYNALSALAPSVQARFVKRQRHSANP